MQIISSNILYLNNLKRGVNKNAHDINVAYKNEDTQPSKSINKINNNIQINKNAIQTLNGISSKKKTNEQLKAFALARLEELKKRIKILKQMASNSIDPKQFAKELGQVAKELKQIVKDYKASIGNDGIDESAKNIDASVAATPNENASTDENAASDNAASDNEQSEIKSDSNNTNTNIKNIEEEFKRKAETIQKEAMLPSIPSYKQNDEDRIKEIQKYSSVLMPNEIKEFSKAVKVIANEIKTLMGLAKAKLKAMAASKENENLIKDNEDFLKDLADEIQDFDNDLKSEMENKPPQDVANDTIQTGQLEQTGQIVSLKV